VMAMIIVVIIIIVVVIIIAVLIVVVDGWVDGRMDMDGRLNGRTDFGRLCRCCLSSRERRSVDGIMTKSRRASTCPRGSTASLSRAWIAPRDTCASKPKTDYVDFLETARSGMRPCYHIMFCFSGDDGRIWGGGLGYTLAQVTAGTGTGVVTTIKATKISRSTRISGTRSKRGLGALSGWPQQSERLCWRPFVRIQRGYVLRVAIATADGRGETSSWK
jgi:hypothetical protein